MRRLDAARKKGTTMKQKRNRPLLGITLDQDVHDWIKYQAVKRRLKVSQIINTHMADLMSADTEYELQQQAQRAARKGARSGK